MIEIKEWSEKSKKIKRIYKYGLYLFTTTLLYNFIFGYLTEMIFS